MSRSDVLSDTGTIRALPDLPRRMVRTPLARSTSIIEGERFADPKPRDGNEAEQGRVCQGADSMDGGKPRRFLDDLHNLLIAIDIRTGAAVPARNEPLWWYFVSRIDPAQPLGKLADHPQTGRPCSLVGFAELGLPCEEQVGRGVFRLVAASEGNKSPQYPCRCAEVISQAAADREIAVKLLDQGAHFAPPATGHSRATARNPSTSSLA